MREGGLGLPSFELIGGLAFEASKNENVGGTQEMRTIKHDHSVIAYLHTLPGWADWLAANRKEGASLWIRACRQINNSAYGSALLLRIRAHDADGATAVCPHCKSHQAAHLMLSHILGCARQKGIGPATRHSAVLTEVISAARNAGLIATRELTLTSAPTKRADGSDHRMDAVIQDERKLFYVDVTVRSTTAKSHSEGSAEKAKQKLYLSAAVAAGAELVVFRLDALGGFSKAASSMCKTLTAGSCQTYEDLRTSVSWHLAVQNGMMYAKWRKFQPQSPGVATASDGPGFCAAAFLSDDEDD
jgi:hypothetical protein